ncbi:MAG: sigma-54-dependent Fis family transcriptional regulator [Acidobacteria bacterium]|nr:sigma-54-dependent Fis family transcriptional regulator [Acidobacteriota bacterium]
MSPVTPDVAPTPPLTPVIVGDDLRLRRVMSQLLRAARSDATVLLEGESGTGKELFARTLHVLSERTGGPFVAINCAAIPDTLLESELFGHEKGSFTGASARKLGKFEVAHRGTLFLDEIGDLPIGLQAKIIRALETREFERIGGNIPVRVDVRVVAATNKNLKAAVAARQFREDLYFRLSVFPITIPPLRERQGDIPILARYFIERFCRDLKKKTLELGPDAEAALCAYSWPGNVRELQNCIERAVILAEGPRIEPRHLNLSFQPRIGQPEAFPMVPSDGWEAFDFSGTLAQVTRRAVTEVEKRKLARAMEEAGGNKARAAEMLQIGYKALTAKLRRHGLEKNW